jgi:hypothetical protein
MPESNLRDGLVKGINPEGDRLSGGSVFDF